jgi:hypothetical protein
MEFPSGIVDEIRQIHLKMKEEVRRLRAEAGELENTEKIWAKLEQFMAKGWALHFISLLEKEEP